MDSLSFDIKSGYTDDCQYRHFLLGDVSEIVQQRRFTRTRPAGNEDASVATLHDIESLTELLVDFYSGLFMLRVCHR